MPWNILEPTVPYFMRESSYSSSRATAVMISCTTARLIYEDSLLQSIIQSREQLQRTIKTEQTSLRNTRTQKKHALLGERVNA